MGRPESLSGSWSREKKGCVLSMGRPEDLSGSMVPRKKGTRVVHGTSGKFVWGDGPEKKRDVCCPCDVPKIRAGGRVFSQWDVRRPCCHIPDYVATGHREGSIHRAFLPGWRWDAIMQASLAGSSSLLHSKVCKALIRPSGCYTTNFLFRELAFARFPPASLNSEKIRNPSDGSS